MLEAAVAADVSMGVAAPADDIGVMGVATDDEPAPPRTTLKLRPQRGRVYIDEVLDGQVFTDSALLQRKMLPVQDSGGTWQLVYDDDGYAGIIDGDGDTLLQVATFLGMAIYDASDGTQHCVDCKKRSLQKYGTTRSAFKSTPRV